MVANESSHRGEIQDWLSREYLVQILLQQNLSFWTMPPLFVFLLAAADALAVGPLGLDLPREVAVSNYYVTRNGIPQ